VRGGEGSRRNMGGSAEVTMDKVEENLNGGIGLGLGGGGNTARVHQV